MTHSIRATEQWTIYPTPAKDFINIFSSEAKPNGYLMEVLDMNGIVVMNVSLEKTPAKVDVSGLKPGHYVSRFTDATTGKMSKACLFTKE